VDSQNEPRLVLTAAEYWEWRTTISEMHRAEEKLNNALLGHKVMQKEAEILAVRSQLYQRNIVDGAREKVEEAKSEYNRFKEQLEKALGTTLSGKLIDDITFEIRGLPEETLKP